MKSSLTVSRLAIFVLIVLASSHASADTQSYSATLANTTVSGTSSPVTLAPFDPALGTLESVQLTLNLTTSSTPAIYTFEAGDTGTVSTGSTISAAEFGNSSPLFSVTYMTPVQTLTSTSAGWNMGATVSGTSSGSQLFTTNLANFESVSGSDLSFTISDGLETSSGSASGGPGQVYVGGSSTYGGTFGVTYTYQPNTQAIPEPSTWALFVGAVAIAGFWKRRAQARSV